MSRPLQPLRGRIGGEPAAVVAHLQQHPVPVDRDPDVHRPRLGVAEDVGERLLQGAEERELRLLRERRQGRRRGEPDPHPAPLAELGDQRAERGQQSQVVQQRRTQVVGDVPDASDPGIDEAEHLVEPRGLRRGSASRMTPELHLDRGEDLAGLVVQLAGEPPPLLLVLLDHPRGEARQLDGAGLQPAVEIRVLQRRPDLLAERHQEAVVERGERIAGVAHQDERADHRLVPEQRQHRGVGVALRRRRSGRSNRR